MRGQIIVDLGLASKPPFLFLKYMQILRETSELLQQILPLQHHDELM